MPFIKKDRLPIWVLPDDHPVKKGLLDFIEEYRATFQLISKPFGVDIWGMHSITFKGYKQDTWKYILLLIWSYNIGKMDTDYVKNKLKQIFKRNYELEYDKILKNPKLKALIGFIGKKSTNLTKEENLEALANNLLNYKFVKEINFR